MSWRKSVTRAVVRYREQAGLSCRALGEQMGITGSAVSQKTCNDAWNLEDIEKLVSIGVPIPWPAQGASLVPGHELVARLEGQEQAARTVARAMKAGPVAMTLTASDMAVVLATVEAIEASISAQLNILAKKKKVNSNA